MTAWTLRPEAFIFGQMGFSSVFLSQVVLVIGLGAAISIAAPVSLDDSYRSAIEKSEVVKQGVEQLSQTDARIDQMWGGVYPNVGFNVFHQIQPLPSDPIAAQFSPQHQTTVSFSATQPLFRGLREWNAIKGQTYLRHAQEANQDLLLNRLYQDVATTYLQILGFEQDLKNLREQQSLYEKRVKELEGRAVRGESNQTDVVSAQATEAALTAEVRLTEGQLDTARETFAYLTGLPRESELVDPQVIRTPTSTQIEKVEPVEKFLEKSDRRPDIRAAIARLEAAEKGVSVAWGGHYPSIDAVGNYYITRPGFLKDLKWDVGVRLTLPLFEGGATQAKVAEAVSRRKEAELDLARLRRSAHQDIRTIHRRLLARLDQLASLGKSATLSEKNSTLIQRDFRRGLSRNIDVQLALTEHRVAQRSFDQAHFAVQLDVYQLRAAVGDLPTVSP